MTSKQAQVVLISLMSLTNQSLPVRILYVTIKLEKAWNIKTSLLVGKESEKIVKEWLFMNPWQPAMNHSALTLLFSGLVIFSLKVFYLHRKNWAGGMSSKDDF